MKKAIAVFVTTAILLSGTTAFAETLTKEQLVAQLKAKIQELTLKLQELQKAEAAVKAAQQELKSSVRQFEDLKEGMTGDDVKELQKLLAEDRSIYPEGKVTGYYGKMTREAVKRYLKKHGRLPKPCAAYDDSKTWNNGIGWGSNKEKPGNGHGRGRDHDEDEDEDNDRYERKKNPCTNNTGGNGTTTPPVVDTTAPVISAISVSGVTSSGATVSWTTNEKAVSKIYLATSSPVGTTTAVWTSALGTTSTATVTGLLANTVYYYVLSATDPAGNTSWSTQGSFVTLVTPDTTAPVITALSISGVSSSTATVGWTTNEAANTRVYVSKVSPVNIGTATLFQNATLVTSHTIGLSGLSTSTTYYMIATSADASGNTATSSELSFVTSN